MMDDLIKRQDAIKSVGFYSCHSGDKLLFADNALKNIPSADAVEVVRCKNCKHLFEDNWCPLRYFKTHREDDFCSYGERKTNG